MFGGEQIVSEDDLEDAQPYSMYKADGKTHENERDIAKYWNKYKIVLALFASENQSSYDPDMPLRGAGYDGASYRAQLNSGNKQRYPVFSLVLYFGDTHWKANHTLAEAVNFPPGLKERMMPFFNDYKINLFEIAFLTEEQVRLFRSDFRVVAEYFVKSRKDPEYIPDDIVIHHVDAVLKLLSVMTGDRRFEEILVSPEIRKGEVRMSEVLDRAIAKGEARGRAKGEAMGIAKGEAMGIAKGEAIGIARGEARKSKEIALNLHKEGLDTGFISRVLNVDEKEINTWIQLQ